MSTFCPANRASLYLRPSVAPIFGLVLPLETQAEPCYSTPTSSATQHPTRPAELGTRRLDALASWSTGHEGKTLLDINDRLHDRALEDATDYVSAHLDECPGIFKDRDFMGHYIAQQFTSPSGVWLEFGVWTGTSINYFAKELPRFTFYGFDSFVGLPEDWSSGFPTMRGTFNMHGTTPDVEPNVTLVKGTFKDTIPPFVKRCKEDLANLRCLYIDSDLYSSCVTVLEGLRNYIRPGLLILFDEYLGFPNWRKGEFKAWQEFCQRYNISYRYKAFHNWMAFVEVTDG